MAELVLTTDPGVIERSADPVAFVVTACERAKAWLREALEHGEIEQIAELRSQADAVRVYTTQKQLGKDAQLAAAEIVRRAERGIGLAIRRGQQDGTIRRRGGHGGNQHRRAEAAETTASDFCAAKPSDYASAAELTGNGAGIYHLTDGVADTDFEAALAAAKAEADLSRANVVRKISQHRGADPAAPPREAACQAGAAPGAGESARPPGGPVVSSAEHRREVIGELAAHGMTSGQIAARLGLGDQRVRQLAREHGITIVADAVVGRARRLDANRIAREAVHALEGLAMSVELADLAQINPALAPEWAGSLTRSLRVLTRFTRQLKEVPPP
jgi:hypothetical protein